MVVETNWLHPSVYLFFTFALSLSLRASLYMYSVLSWDCFWWCVHWSTIWIMQILFNPLYLPGSRITSSHFDTKVRALARKYLWSYIFLSSRDSIAVERAAKLDCSSPNSLFNLVCDFIFILFQVLMTTLNPIFLGWLPSTCRRR